MSPKTARNPHSIRTLARSTAMALVLTFSLWGGAASADLADRVSDIKSTVNNIKKKVDPAVVGQLIEIVGDTKDVLDSIQAKREGFDGCKNGDAADQMRRDLKNLFEDLRVLADTSHPTRYVGHGDRREDPHPTAACGATERIDLEDPLQEIVPGRAAERGKGASDERLESSSCVERHRAGFNRFSG